MLNRKELVKLWVRETGNYGNQMNLRFSCLNESITESEFSKLGLILLFDNKSGQEEI